MATKKFFGFFSELTDYIASLQDKIVNGAIIEIKISAKHDKTSHWYEIEQKGEI